MCMVPEVGRSSRYKECPAEVSLLLKPIMVLADSIGMESF